MAFPKVKIADDDGNVADVQSNRLDVNSSHSAGMGTLTTYNRFTASESSVSLTHSSNGINTTETNAKEVIIQAAHANSGSVTVGSIGVSTDTQGIRLDAGDTIVLPVADISGIYTDGSAAGQNVFVAIVK